MINKLLLPALALLLLASCSNKMSLVKRKYNKGFYVSVNKKNNSAQVAKNTESFKHSPVKVQANEKNQEIIHAEPATSSSEQIAIAGNSAISKKTQSDSYGAVTASADSKNNLSAVKQIIKPLKTTDLIKISRAAKGSDANKVVLVILALFPILCLIAVYLHDNSITLNFWITLLLHLTFIGAMIFAILVVLDIVNLA